MTDTNEMETSLLEASENCPNAYSSQDVLQVQSFLPGGIPRNEDPEITGSGSPSQRQLKSKAKTRASSRLSKQPSKSKINYKAQGPPSAEVPVKLPLPKIDLKALIDYHSRQRQQRQRCRKKRTPPDESGSTSNKIQRLRPTIRPRIKISREEKNRRRRQRGCRFPFAEKFYKRERIPLRMECQYQQGALKGFFKYIEQLKYEHHLKKSLTQLDAGDDLENECLESRKHKYLDDDGPLSPIEETEDDQHEDSSEKDIGARIVENSCFILSSIIPKRKKSKKTSIKDGTVEQNL